MTLVVQTALRLPQSYSRESNLIRDIFVENINDFYHANGKGQRIPKFVKKEVNDFIKCGVLAHGFLKLYCHSCKTYDVLAFSCKRRGFCPSCSGRRMNDTAIHLHDNVFPRKPVRQWVLSFPFFIRYLMAYDPEVVNKILKIHTKVISSWYESQCKEAMGCKGAKTGSVTVVQRFGAALNMNPHFHSIFVDGSFYKKGEKVLFYKSRTPNQKQLEAILKQIIKKTTSWLTKKSYIKGEYSSSGLKNNLMSNLHRQSVVYRIAVGKRKGEKIQLVGCEAERPKRNKGGGDSLQGFNIHAGVFIGAKKREQLQTLCRYIARGPLSKQRVQRLKDDKVIIHFKKAWSDGTTYAVYTNIEFIEKLIALVPPARANLVRYHGVFAPNNKWRKEIVPASREVEGVAQERIYRLPWAELLKRIFGVAGEVCKSCGGKIMAVSLVMDFERIKATLNQLGIESRIIVLKPLSHRGPPENYVEQKLEEDYSQVSSDW